MQDWLESLYPEIIADNASKMKAKNSMLIADAEESVNTLSCSSLILLVKGTADEAADIKKYATICNSRTFNFNDSFH